MNELTKDTEQQLTTASQMLTNVGAFDGTVDQTSVNDLIQLITFYSNTIESLVSSAMQLLSELNDDQLLAQSALVNITAEELMIQELLDTSSLAEDSVNTVESLVAQFELQREDLRNSLTNLSLEAIAVVDRLTSLNTTLMNASRDASDIYDNVDDFKSNLTALRSQTDYVLNVTRQLNNSVDITNVASQTLEENTNNLLVCMREHTLMNHLFFFHVHTCI